MAKGWRDPIRLRPHWRILLRTAETFAFMELSIVFLFCDPQNHPVWKWGSFAIGVLGLIGALTIALTEEWGSRDKPFIRLLIQELSTDLWAKPQEDLDGFAERHRVTLFVVLRRCWIVRIIRQIQRWTLKQFPYRAIRFLLHGRFADRYTHKLHPILRFPTTARAPRRIFRIHEDHERECEGVAGLVYHRRKLATGVLPDLHAANMSDDACKEYAKLTNDDWHRVQEEEYYARRIAGVVVQAGGLRWGILILDSSDPESVTEKELDSEAMNRTIRILTELVQEARS